MSIATENRLGVGGMHNCGFICNETLVLDKMFFHQTLLSFPKSHPT